MRGKRRLTKRRNYILYTVDMETICNMLGEKDDIFRGILRAG